MTHDYRRNGTTTLFAALNTLDGTVISDTMPRHRHDEWLRFLKRLHRETPKNLALHIICDNYATHKHPAVMEWLEEHKRVHIHFTPTSSSWLNMVERFFRSLDPEERMRSSGLQFGHSVPFHHVTSRRIASEGAFFDPFPNLKPPSRPPHPDPTHPASRRKCDRGMPENVYAIVDIFNFVIIQRMVG
jgi:hypothetical protein